MPNRLFERALVVIYYSLKVEWLSKILNIHNEILFGLTLQFKEVSKWHIVSIHEGPNHRAKVMY